MISNILSEKYTLGSSGVWKHSGSPAPFNYSDGTEVENRILEQLTQITDLSLGSDSLQQLIIDWPSEYHFSPLRSNLLSPFKLDQFKTILEVGSGCGAITRLLGEKCTTSDIVALEGSLRRAEITRARCRDLSNVNVCCESFADFEHTRPFDLITMIGVLEYSPSFLSGDNPVLAALSYARSLLNQTGTLVIAIENQLGLKYFNGCTEDHTGTAFTGINDLYQPGTVRTFGKQQLIAHIMQAGFTNVEFVYPFPDYKLPQLLLREDSLNSNTFDGSYLASQYHARNYGFDGERVFHEGRVLKQLAQNGLLKDLANSFLAFASVDGPSIDQLSDPWLAYTFSCSRKKQYLVETVFSEEHDGKIVVKKNTCYQSNTLLTNSTLSTFNHHVGIADYVKGIPYRYNLPFQLSRHGAMKAFISYLTPWFKWLRDHAAPDVDNRQSGSFLVSGKFYDCLPSNFLVNPDNELHIIDQEWESTNPLELGFLLFRGLYGEISQNLYLFEQTDIFNDSSVYDLSKVIFNHFGLPLDIAILDRYIDIEIDFQLEVVIYNTDKKGLQVNFRSFFHEPRHQRFSTGDLLSSRGVHEYSELLGQKDNLSQRVSILRNRLNERNRHISSLQKSISWRMTEPLRILGSLLRWHSAPVASASKRSKPSHTTPKWLNEYLINRQIKKLNVGVRRAAPYFSVIIPIYDRTDEVREAVNSILSQTFRSFELILVCDGSPPETIEVVNSYAGNPHIKTHFFTDNSGNPCRGRNKGIELSRGQYIAFLDSDDIALPDRLKRTLFHILEKNVDVVGGAVKYLTEQAEQRGFKNGQVGFTSEECTYDQLIAGNRLSICTVAVRKSCLSNYGTFREDMRYREDHELWLRLAYHGCSFYNSPEVFSQYRVHENNAELLYLDNDHYWRAKAIELHRKSSK